MQIVFSDFCLFHCAARLYLLRSKSLESRTQASELRSRAGLHLIHSLQFASASCVAATKTEILSELFIPCSTSTPLLTSTPHGRSKRTAWPTFSGFRPPDRMSGRDKGSARTSSATRDRRPGRCRHSRCCSCRTTSPRLRRRRGIARPVRRPYPARRADAERAQEALAVVRALLRRFVAVELQQLGADLIQHGAHLVISGIDEQRHHVDEGGRAAAQLGARAGVRQRLLLG